MSDAWIQAHFSGATTAGYKDVLRNRFDVTVSAKKLRGNAKTQSPIFSQRVVGLRLRVARKSAGLSQRQLARKAGLSSWQLSRIERGRVNLYLQTFARLVDALGASASELLFGERGQP